MSGRTEVLDCMLARGAPVNGLIFDAPLVYFAVGDLTAGVVECLVRAGADLDLKARHGNMSARELARVAFEHDPANTNRRRIAELCGLDPDAIIAERAARPLKPPGIHPHFQQALELANDDAARLGQAKVRPENLLFGMLRNRQAGLNAFTRLSEIDRERFRADVNGRMYAAHDRIESARLPLHLDAQAIVDEAIALAAERRRGRVYEMHLLYVLVRDEVGYAAELLSRYGGNASKISTELERWL
jgi:hypothetical protein